VFHVDLAYIPATRTTSAGHKGMSLSVPGPQTADHLSRIIDVVSAGACSAQAPEICHLLAAEVNNERVLLGESGQYEAKSHAEAAISIKFWLLTAEVFKSWVIFKAGSGKRW
jgi:hypothetical protein